MWRAGAILLCCVAGRFGWGEATDEPTFGLFVQSPAREYARPTKPEANLPRASAPASLRA